LVGYRLDEEVVRPGDEVQLTLYWRAESETERNYKVFLHLTVPNHADQKVGQCDTLLGGTNYPTSLWHAGDLVRGEYTISLSPDAPTPRVYEVRVGLYNLESGAPLMEQELGYAPVLTRIWSSDAASSEPEPSVEVNFQLGDAVRLHGYNLELSSDGEELSLTLYWTTLGPMPADYHVFVHLVDATGKLVAQRDAPPLGGEYPTSAWRVGERLVDTYEVKLSSVPIGSYTVYVGMYLLSSGERVPVYDENGTALSMRAIPLTQVQVVRKNDQ